MDGEVMADEKPEDSDDSVEMDWLEYMQFILHLGPSDPQLKEHSVMLTDSVVEDATTVLELLNSLGYNANLSSLAQIALRGMVDLIADEFHMQLPSRRTE